MEISINELSSGVYEVVARDATGPRFRTTGADPETLIETARAWVRENGAGYLPASHYLWIYRIRLDRAESGRTQGSRVGVEFMRELVGNLVKLDPSTPVGLEMVCGLARFTDATTGALLGEIFVGTDHDRGE
jgi:hypothetical protein